MIIYNEDGIGINFESPKQAMLEIEDMLMEVLEHTNNTYCNGNAGSLRNMKEFIISGLQESLK